MTSRRQPLWIHLAAYAAMALLFVPLILIFVQSFNANRHGQTWGGFTLKWYAKLAQNHAVLDSAWNTLAVGLCSTLIATLLGTLLAIGLHRTPWPKRVRAMLLNAVHLPVVSPDILIAVGLVGIYSLMRQVSPIFEPGLLTLIIGHATFQVSFVALVVLARLASIGTEQMEAARDLYASTWGAWKRVMLPQLATGIAAGALIAFTLSLDDFIISFFVSGPRSQTLPLLIYASLRRGISPEIHALSSILVTGTVLLILGFALHSSSTLRASTTWLVLRRILSIGGLIVLGLMVAILTFGKPDQIKSANGKNPITVLMYSEYIDPDLLPAFTQATGYPIQLELYEAQEEMIGKLLAAGTAQYDIIVASDVMIPQMVNLGLIQAMDSTLIPNRKHVDPLFQNPPFDPGHRYTVPYLWGTTGLLYKDSLDPDSITWGALFDPTKTGSFTLLDESRTMLSIALNALGKDPNSRQVDDIRAAAHKLLEAKRNPHCIGFDGSVAGKDKVLAGMVRAAVVFNGEAMAAINEDSTLQYAIPREGSSVWVDVMTLSAQSTNIAGAHAFMNFILDPENGAALANYIQYGSPNASAKPYLTPDDLENPVIYPDSAIMARLKFLEEPGSAARLFDEAWTTVKSR